MAKQNQHIPKGFKPSPLGPVPEEWEVESLGNVINYKKGYAFKKEQYKAEGVRIVRVSDTNADGIKQEGLVFLDKNEAVSFSEYQLLQNDVIIQTVGSRPPLFDSMVGKTIIVSEDFEGSLLNQNAVRIRAKNGNNKFLFSNLKTKRYFDFIETLVRGNANQVSITLEDVFNYSIPYPDKNEQTAIASCLSTWDKAISNVQLTITNLEQRKKWLMQQLLTGKKRLKGFKGEWKEIHIRDIAKEVSIKNKTDKQLTVLSCTKYDGLVPSLEYFGRKIFADDVSTYKIVPKNHFAYATNHIEEGSIGYQGEFSEALISPMYTVFKTDASINNSFLYALLKSHRLVYEYNARMEGSIDRRGGLRWDAFSIIKILIPSTEEQTAIASVLQTADKEIKLRKHKLAQLKDQKKWLMQQLLTGKKRLKVKK